MHQFKKESIHLEKHRFIFYAVRVFLQKMSKTVSENLCLLLSHGQGLRGELLFPPVDQGRLCAWLVLTS